MFFNLAALVAAASLATASPFTRLQIRQGAAVTDADVLQYALTLEHLENAFYKKALSMWPEAAFVASGQTAAFYNQLKYVAHDEESHVQVLTAGLKAAGAAPVAACTYNFPMTTPAEFIALAAVVEGLGVSAYLGGAPLITSKAYLTAAGSILATEAIHQSALRNGAKLIPMANPYATPLGLNAVFTQAAAFIKACPPTNAKLPVSAFPALTLKSGLPTASGAQLLVNPAKAPTGNWFVTFLSGLTVTSVKADKYENGWVTVTVPAGIEGQSYVFITNAADGATFTEANVLAGPAIIEATPAAPTFDLSIQ